MIAKRTGTCILTALIFSLIILQGNLFTAQKADAQDLSSILSQISLFSNLTPLQIDILKTAAVLKKGGKGEKIIHQGQSMGKMTIVLDGEADVLINGQHIVALSGQFLLGEIEFLDGQPASADVILGKDTNMVQLDNIALNRVFENHPDIGYVIMRQIAVIEAERLRKQSSK